MKYLEKKSNYIDEKYDFSIDKQPIKGLIASLICMLPGCVLWLILTFYTPIGGTMGIIITIGILLGYRIKGNYMSYKVKNLLLLLGFFVMVMLTSIITSYTLYYEYTYEVISQANKDDVIDDFKTNLKNNGQTTETNEIFLKKEYNIDGFNDVKGFDKVAKKTLDMSYIEAHKVPCVPNNPINALRCLYPFVAYDREIGKPFMLNIISGFIFSLLTATIMLKFDYFKPDEF